MNWFYKLLVALGLKSPEAAGIATLPKPKSTPPLPAVDLPRERPLGLDNGRVITIDPGLSNVMADLTRMPFPEGEQVIWSSGEVELGLDTYLQRFYFEDDRFWLQVVTTGSLDGQIEALTLFHFDSVVTVHTKAEMERLAGPQTSIGLPTYEYNGNSYERMWGSEEGQTHLVEFFESIVNPNSRYKVKHHAMLYSREISNSDRRELLLIQVEEAEGDAVTMTISTGLFLYTADISVI